MRRPLPFLVAGLCAAQSPAPAPAPADPFAALRFLEGDWMGEGTGTPGEGAGGFSFRRELDGKVLVRRNHADYPATQDRPASHHEDLMVVHAEGPALKADYFDNEGHAIRYDVRAEGDAVRFLSETGSGPRFRLGYRRTGPDTVAITFDMTAPGKDFVPYLQARARKKR